MVLATAVVIQDALALAFVRETVADALDRGNV
jgi:hypothetical protein